MKNKKINEKNLKKLYISHCESSAPDMDSLWEKIESGLEEKPENRVTSKPARTFNFRRAVVWCTVCAAAVIAVPAFVIGTSISNDTSDFVKQDAVFEGDMVNETFNAAANSDGEFVKDPAAELNDEESISETIATSLPEMVFYEELALNTPVATEETLPFPTAEPFGDEFFVEENVLKETDIIVDAVVQDVVYSSSGDTVIYVLSGAEDEDHNSLGKIAVESAARYTLKLDREYILPLKETEDGYRLVFENAPQIECTLDGGIIFHNGWESLDENSCWVSYPKNNVDDFFYDRMRFSYADGMASLTEKWKAVKNYAKEE